MKRAVIVVAALAAAAPHLARAESPAVHALLQQAQYWKAKGRGDLAQAALRRAARIEPDNADVKRALAAPGAAPAPAPAPVAAPAPAPALREAAAPAPRRARAQRTPTVANSDDAAGRQRVAGFAALDRGELAAATRAFDAALAHDRRDADALGGRGLVALKQGRFAAAQTDLEQASRLGDPDKWAEALASARRYAGLGNAQDLLARGDLAGAASRAEALVRETGGRDANALALLGDIYDRQGRYADSADLYRQAAELGRPGAKASEARLASRAARSEAQAAAARGDDLGAEQAFQQGLMLDADDPWIRFEFARFMIGRGRVPEAQSLVQALAASTKPDSLYAAGMLYADLGQPAAAEALMARIPDSYRTPPMRSFAMGLKTDTAIARARALAGTGQKAQAIAALRQIANAKGLPAARVAAIADALYDFGDSLDAGSLAQQAMAGTITDLGGYEAVIRVAARTGRDDLAQTALQRAGQLAGNSPDGQRSLARISAGLAVARADRMRQHGQMADAFDTLQAAWSSAPDNPEILGALARLYQSGNMAARAAQTFQLVLARSPRDRDALTGLMQTAQAAGDRTLSQSAETRLLATYPQIWEVWLAAARVEQARGSAGTATRYFKTARDLYERQTATPQAGATGNPFASVAASGAANPFRNAGAAVAAQPAAINPFTLGGGTRLPTPAAAVQPVDTAGFPETPAVSGAAWPGPAAAPVPAPFGAPVAGMAPAAMAPGDPVLAGITTEIANLAEDRGPRAEVKVGFRSRTGETGLSALHEESASAEVSTGLGGGRVFVRADAEVIDSGRPVGDSLQRFGTDATIEANAIVNKVAAQFVQAATQRAAGIAPTVGYGDKLVKVEAGTTPTGFGKARATWHAEVTPQLSETVNARAWFERKPVTDSVLAYAGARDPVTGEMWGQVMRTGGGAALSWYSNGNGIYGSVAYNGYNGLSVPSNHNVEANVGAFFRVKHGEHSTLTAGVNANYQSFGNPQDYFTYGMGGYFSPQSFLALGMPINYTYNRDALELKANFTPGFQSFLSDQVALYPTDPVAQAQLDALKAKNSDVRSTYDSLSQTGFAFSASGSAWYRISPQTRIGGDVSYNTFGSYDEFKALLGLRQAFGGVR